PLHRWGGAGLRGAGAGPGTGRSATQTQAGDERTVALDVDLLQVLEHPAALADQEQQSATRVVVVLVLLEVLREILDPTGHDRDLHLGRTGVALVCRVFLHDLLLDLLVQSHVSPPWCRCAAPAPRVRALWNRGR